MSAGLLELFRDTERPSPSGELVLGRTSDPQASAAESSAFLRRYLGEQSRLAETVPTGLAGLDDCLGGGFGPGLHLVIGPAEVGKTAFLESVAWEAISSARPVLYYALDEGVIGAWERMISTFACFLGIPIDVEALRDHRLSADGLESLARVDLAFQSSVLPYLSLVDSLPASSDAMSALPSDISSRAREAKERHGLAPLLLIDDLGRLLLLAPAEPLPHLLGRLDDVLAADSITGLLAGAVADPFSLIQEELPVRTVVTLSLRDAYEDDHLVHVNMEVQGSSPTSRSATLPMVLERRTGLFAQSSGR